MDNKSGKGPFFYVKILRLSPVPSSGKTKNSRIPRATWAPRSMVSQISGGAMRRITAPPTSTRRSEISPR